MNTSNAMTQVAKIYQHLERLLRQGAADGYPRSVKDLSFKVSETTEVKNPLQVPAAIRNLNKRGHLTEVEVDDQKMYTWNLKSPPFLLAEKKIAKASKLPSKVEVIKTPNAVVTSMAQIAKEVELVMGDISVIIGRNPTTGRVRITIDEV
jgi:hypothetical protein